MSDFNNEEREIGNANTSRRGFISLLPLGIFGAIVATFLVATKKVLSPQIAAVEASKTSVENWTTLGSLSDMKSEEPLERKVIVERTSGWAKTTEEQIVYILPKHDYKVVSAVCPHEGCPVIWDGERKNFVCPCHDSFFSDSGVHLRGPASGDMIQVQKKVEDGKLQIQTLT